MDGKGRMINEQSQPKPKKRFYNEDPSMGNKDRVILKEVVMFL